MGCETLTAQAASSLRLVVRLNGEGITMDNSTTELKDLLCLLVKAALLSNDHESQQYRLQAQGKQKALASQGDVGFERRLSGAWTMAIAEAEAPKLRDREGRVSLTLPVECPLSVADLLSPQFDTDLVVNRIAGAAATG